MTHSKKIINALSDTRFAPDTFVTGLLREPLDTQEMFIYTFIRYVYTIRSYAEHDMLSDDMTHIKEWCIDLSRWMEKHLTQ